MKSNNTVKLTESNLRDMIKEAVEEALKEGVNNGLHEDLNEIIQRLEELTNSSYIPFSSPSPSSTEAVVKQNVIKAIELLKNADFAASQLYHGVQRR